MVVKPPLCYAAGERLKPARGGILETKQLVLLPCQYKGKRILTGIP